MFIINMVRNIVFVIYITTVSGCGISSFSTRLENPVIESDTNDSAFLARLFHIKTPSFSSFATTASRRTINILQDSDKNRIEICSEPSPDVGEAVASAVANAIAVKAPIEGVPTELSNQYAHAISTQIASLIYRTQGLQLYRDAMHNLCIDRMNSWFLTNGKGETTITITTDPEKLLTENITVPNSYEGLRAYYFTKSFELIKAELANKKDVDMVSKINAGNPDTSTIVKQVVDILNSVKPAPAAAK